VGPSRAASARETLPGYYTTVATDFSLEWLKKQPRDRPWAVCLGHKAPHSFYVPEPKYAHAFDDVRVSYPASALDLAGKPAWIGQRLTTWHGIYGPLFEWRKQFPDSRPEAVTDFENMVHAYWGTVLSVDDSVGRLMAFLESTGQTENTLVIFMGDNGLLEGEHGMVDKRTMHEPNIRGIRTDRHKFVRYPHGDAAPDRHVPEMYDLQVDPGESRNLADDPAHAATRAELERRLDDLLASFGLDGGRDVMPIDEGIKAALPDTTIR
jgi:arylsulfatase A-like enzyme